nr:exodeoxyribonuclease VII small subunit [Oceanisphaera pacifica]
MVLLLIIIFADRQRIPVATKKPENMDFESALAELESLVNQLEEGDLSLEQSLKSFERGVQLVRAGQHRLSNAEQQVQILLQQDEEQLAPFATSQEER